MIHILNLVISLWGLARIAYGQDYTYLGCFYDNNRREILPDLIYCDRSRHPYETCQNVCGLRSQYCQSQDMTIELCRDICADQNMKYFGVSAGSQCYCGGYFAPYNFLGQPTGLTDICNRPCSGNSSQMCGADFQARTYRMNEPASDCFNPGYVLNGDQSQQDSSLYSASDVIDFTSVCPHPSIKNGAASIMCTASGNWTDPPPTCTVRCATPSAPMHASFSAGQTLNDSYAVHDVVLYDCDNDLTRTNQVLTCGYYGDWGSWETCPGSQTSTSTTTQGTTAQPNDPSTTTVSTVPLTSEFTTRAIITTAQATTYILTAEQKPSTLMTAPLITTSSLGSGAVTAVTTDNQTSQTPTMDDRMRNLADHPVSA